MFLQSDEVNDEEMLAQNAIVRETAQAAAQWRQEFLVLQTQYETVSNV